MNFDDFIKKYNGKFVEYHSYGNVAINQCIDLVNQYFIEVLGVQTIIGTDAVDVPSKVNSNDFEWIKNGATNAPVKGDVVVWSGVWGHIAICYEANSNDFVSFDQNWPTGSACKLVGHDYTNVLGWLHPKAEVVVNEDIEMLKIDSNNWKFLRTKYDISDPQQIVDKVDGLVAEREALKAQVKSLTDEVSVKTTEVNTLKPLATEWEATKKAYGVSSFTDLDKIIREYKDIIANPPQTGTCKPEVLKQCKTDLAQAKKLSVKVVSKTTLIKELISRIYGG